MFVDARATAIELFDVWMIARIRQHTRDDAALLGHAHALGHALGFNEIRLAFRHGIYPSIIRRPVLHKVPAQYQRALSAGIVTRTAADFPESRARVKPQRRDVVLVDLQEHRPQAQAGKTAQMQIEQPPREPTSLPGARDR